MILRTSTSVILLLNDRTPSPQGRMLDQFILLPGLANVSVTLYGRLPVSLLTLSYCACVSLSSPHSFSALLSSVVSITYFHPLCFLYVCSGIPGLSQLKKVTPHLLWKTTLSIKVKPQFKSFATCFLRVVRQVLIDLSVVLSGTKASSEALSSRVFQSRYGEHFTITASSQWVQGNSYTLMHHVLLQTCMKPSHFSHPDFNDARLLESRSGCHNDRGIQAYKVLTHICTVVSCSVSRASIRLAHVLLQHQKCQWSVWKCTEKSCIFITANIPFHLYLLIFIRYCSHKL